MVEIGEPVVRPKWLCLIRRRDSSAPDNDTRGPLEQSASDRGRVVFCEYFRRLNQKMQVFALESDGVVRTRLTHSLEVAHNGMYIVDSVFLDLDACSSKQKEETAVRDWCRLSTQDRQAVRTFVEVACLVHDIGNPPFGHFGEKAIQGWFRKKKLKLPKEKEDEQRRDFENFDGNKQGFRILTRLQRNLNDRYGLNLTSAQLAATVKYPVEVRGKSSIFASEQSVKQELWKNLGLRANERHPLALFMEAADDIAYCVSDVEDADAKGLIRDEDVITAFGERAQGSDRRSRFTRGRTKLTTELVKQAAKTFVDRCNAAPAGASADTTESLLDDDKGPLADIKSVARQRIYASRVVMTNEITGFKVIHGLLDALEPLLEMDRIDFEKLCRGFLEGTALPRVAKNLTAEPGVLSLVPRELLAVYLEADDREDHELFHRAHLLVDFIAAMTDAEALRLYRLVSGQATYANPHGH